MFELPLDVFEWKGLQTLRVGVRLGEAKNGRFEPSHALAMCLGAADCKNMLNLSQSDGRVQKFWHGETLDCAQDGVENGWCLVCVEGLGIGWGKVVNGVLKNHLPKGLRKAEV